MAAGVGVAVGATEAGLTILLRPRRPELFTTLGRVAEVELRARGVLVASGDRVCVRVRRTRRAREAVGDGVACGLVEPVTTTRSLTGRSVGVGLGLEVGAGVGRGRFMNAAAANAWRSTARANGPRAWGSLARISAAREERAAPLVSADLARAGALIPFAVAAL